MSEENQKEVRFGSAVLCRTALQSMPVTGAGHCYSSSAYTLPPIPGTLGPVLPKLCRYLGQTVPLF